MHKRILAILFLGTLLATVAGLADERQEPQQPPDGTPRFEAWDLRIDAGANRLAAYQVELSYPPDRVKIVGLEGGETAAFKNAPYYDPAGMEGGRIIIAAFATDDDAAPAGKTRVARVHVQVTGGTEPGLQTKVVVAAQPGGAQIGVETELTRSVK
ncbi:MAG: hypothetical protein RDV41_11785 [Planctomycetota bacterium]|nr:hypothetical protein [Planctomycetota bacterium]